MVLVDFNIQEFETCYNLSKEETWYVFNFIKDIIIDSKLIDSFNIIENISSDLKTSKHELRSISNEILKKITSAVFVILEELGKRPTEERLRKLFQEELQRNIVGDYEKISKKRINNIIEQYKKILNQQVSKVRIFGDETPYDLEKVFIDLNVIDYKRPSHRNYENIPIVDSKTRKKYKLPDHIEEKDKIETKIIKPEDLLKYATKVVIVGSPGSGKSTLVRYLSYKTLQQDEKIPIYVELKSITEMNEKNLPDMIFANSIFKWISLTDFEKKSLSKRLEEELKKGNISFF